MTIKRVEFKNKKPHLRYDPATKSYIGWQTDIRGQNGKRLRPTFRTKSEAERFVDAVRENRPYVKARLQTPGQAPRMSDVFARCQDAIVNESEKTRAKRVFPYFAEMLEGNIPITLVRPHHFQLYINARKEDGVKPSTINREINTIASAVHKAPELFPKELEDFDPPKIIRPKYKKGKRHRHEITKVEAHAIIGAILSERLRSEKPQRTAARPTVAWMFEISWMLGLRFSEAKNLLKADLNVKEKSLLVWRGKTRTADKLKFLPERAIEILSNTGTEGPHIFDLPCSVHTFADIIRRACKACGLVYGRDDLDGITFHSTRHAFTSRLIRVTDIATAGHYTGHSSDTMVDYYAHASEESQKQAMERMYGSDDKWREIYDKIVSGELDFEAFLDAVN